MKNTKRISLQTVAVASIAMMLLIWISIFSLPARAQVGTGDIVGTVTDSTGAVVVGARVTLKNIGTASERSAITDGKGEYTFDTVPNGAYALRVESKGFKTFAIGGIALSTGDRARYDALLTAGDVTETVQVSASAAIMQTETSEVTSTVDTKSVVDLPLNGRSLEAAIQVQPGLTYAQNGTTESDRRGSFDIAAANGGTNNEMVDSFDNNERSLGLDGVRPSVDSVQEVKVDTSSYSAEYGRASGAVVNIITKAGTNDFHGSLYEFMRNDALDSYAWGTAPGAQKPELRQNYYGVSAGGPVWIPKLYNGRNKTFFFVDWEQFRQVAGISAQPLSIPTAAEEKELATNGDLDLTDLANLPISASNSATLASLGTSQYILPAADVDPLTKNYFLSYPKPNLACTATYASGCLNYVATPPGTQDLTNLDVRIDEHVGSKDMIFGRFEYEPEKTVEPEEFPQISDATIANGTYSSAAAPLKGIYPGGYGTTFSGPSLTNTYGIQTDYVHIFNQNLLLDLRAGYTRINIQSQPWNYSNGAAQTMGWPANISTSNVLPAIGGPWASWTALEGSSNDEPLIDINNIYQYAGSVTYTHGSHDLKFGAALVRRQINAFQDSIAGGLIFPIGSDIGSNGPPFGGAMTYADDRMNYLNGNFGMILRQDAATHPGYRVWEPSVYALDNWRVNSKFTVNVGLRYDVYTPFQEVHGNYANFLTSCLNASATTVLSNGLSCFVNGTQNPTIGIKTDYFDIQPRIGFAYSFDTKTVLRGAFGTTYFTPDEGLTSIGVASPQSVMQNFNPQSSFNNQTILPNFNGPAGWCSVATSGGSHGCLETGLPQPTLMSSSDINAFASNSSISSVSAKTTSFKNGYAEMMNLALQRQFGGNIVTVAYVGSFGRHLLQLSNLAAGNIPGAAWAAANPGSQVPSPYATELPNINTIGYVYNGSMSSYNSIQAIYSRHFVKGLDFNANYTWGHLLSNECISANGCTFIPTAPSSMEYGGRPSERAAGSVTYTLPFGNNLTGVGAALVKGWNINAIGFWQSGASLTVISGNNTDVANAGNDRPNQTGSASLSHPTIGEWFNTAVFKDQTLGTYGSEHVGQVLAPSARNIDLSVNKDFPIVEKLTGEFRAECFNAGNFANYGDPGVTLGTGNTFGQISSVTNASRVFQFAVKVKF